MSIETKCIAMNTENHWISNFCFNFCFWFLLYLKLLSWNLHFLVVLLLSKFLYERRWRKHFTYIYGWIWAKQGVGEQVWFASNPFGGKGEGWGSGESCNARKIIEFSPSSNFGNSISSTQADKKLLFKY